MKAEVTLGPHLLSFLHPYFSPAELLVSPKEAELVSRPLHTLPPLLKSLPLAASSIITYPAGLSLDFTFLEILLIPGI